MTTTAVFTVTRDQIIRDAMLTMKAIAASASPSATDLSDLTFKLNMMVKLWNTEGYKGWLYKNIPFNAVAGKTSYTIAESGADVTAVRPVRVPRAWAVDSSGNKTPLNKWTRQEFDMATPANAPGPANSFYYEPTSTLVGTFYPWPIPVDTSKSFIVVEQRPIYDVSTSTGSDPFDVPQEMFLALSYGLANLAALQYGVPKDERAEIAQMAEQFKSLALDFDEEDGSVYFQPNPMGYGGMRRG